MITQIFGDFFLIIFGVSILVIIVSIYITRAIFSIGEIVSLLKKIEKNTSELSHLITEKAEQRNPQDIPDKNQEHRL